MMRLLLAGWLLGVGGCMAGAGPTFGLRTSGEVSAGWEAAASGLYVGPEIGQSFPLGPHRATTYFAVHGFGRVDEASDEEDDTAVFLGGSLGLAGGEGGFGLYPSAGSMVLVGDRGCYPREPWVFTAQLGIRWVGGYAGELFLAPKLSYFEPFCSD